MTNLKDYLNDTLLPDEEKEVVDLLAEDKLTAELDKELEEYFNSMTDNDPAVAQTAYFKAKSALGLKRSSVSRRAVSWIMGVAASMILFVLGLWTFKQYLDNIEPNWIEKRVANGDIVSLTLPDGSQLYMNSGTRVTYPDRFTGKTRQIFIDGRESTTFRRTFILSLLVIRRKNRRSSTILTEDSNSFKSRLPC